MTDKEHMHNLEYHLLSIGGNTVVKAMICKECGQYSAELIQTYPDQPAQAMVLYGQENCRALTGFLLNVDARAAEVLGIKQKLDS
jgi:hypothetical protein